MSESDFNVDHALSWAKIAAGLFQQKRPEAVIDHELLLSSPNKLEEETIQSPYFYPRNCKQRSIFAPVAQSYPIWIGGQP